MPLCNPQTQEKRLERKAAAVLQLPQRKTFIKSLANALSSFKCKLVCSKAFTNVNPFFLYLVVNFDHFQILRAIGKGSFGKVGLSSQSCTVPQLSAVMYLWFIAALMRLELAILVGFFLPWLLSQYRKNVQENTSLPFVVALILGILVQEVWCELPL